ncbi:transmembrane protein, putative (macronuclear) [Tetrahymena thermophila SB210]|uniref:Transmembrane protein, putative n=1 Tax=Tetrahymena thermophila (strain SB210) TaxID=312017 RepID=W7XHD1_TETTS|nr:transmembrane protein, putative [Tetrahymena thermophila SB210]EWS76633.1 transmembrane protein, putative [Tetrahymena thermophila SB210]|eukprot:XP_012650801.1 transmembrane protein, putative [Tetrahymena thermophila SB210]
MSISLKNKIYFIFSTLIKIILLFLILLNYLNLQFAHSLLQTFFKIIIKYICQLKQCKIYKFKSLLKANQPLQILVKCISHLNNMLITILNYYLIHRQLIFQILLQIIKYQNQKVMVLLTNMIQNQDKLLNNSIFGMIFIILTKQKLEAFYYTTLQLQKKKKNQYLLEQEMVF